DALMEDMEPVALNFFQQRVVDGGHDQAGTLRPSVDFRQVFQRANVGLPGAVRLELHQRVKFIGIPAMDDVGGRHVKALQLIDGNVDAAAARVIADIPDDIRELEGQPELAGEVQCSGLRASKYRG